MLEYQPKACNFIKKRFQHKCFPVNIVKFLRTAYFTEILRWLLLLLELEKTKDPFTLAFTLFYVFACSSNKYFEFV